MGGVSPPPLQALANFAVNALESIEKYEHLTARKAKSGQVRQDDLFTIWVNSPARRNGFIQVSPPGVKIVRP